MQIQDSDNQVSDPTDLVVKADFNRFRIILGIVLKCWRAEIWRISTPRTQNSQIFSWWNDHRSEHHNQHRTRPGICCLVHKPFLTPKFELGLINSANLCWLLWADHVPSLFHCILRRALTAQRRVILKHKMLHKNLKSLHASEGLINTRLCSVFRQDCNAWLDRACCGPEQKLELCRLTTKF